MVGTLLTVETELGH